MVLSKRLCYIMILFIALSPILAGMSGDIDGAEEGLKDPVKFTILYDNYLHKEGTKVDWGFSCLIEGTEKTILFDTGTQPEILLHNVNVMGVDLKKVQQIVISHNHGDHTGGLSDVLKINPKDAVALGIKTGDWVKVTSPEKSVKAEVKLWEGVRPGTVNKTFGMGHWAYGRVAAQDYGKHVPRGFNNNELLPADYDRLSGSTARHAVSRVKIEKV